MKENLEEEVLSKAGEEPLEVRRRHALEAHRASWNTICPATVHPLFLALQLRLQHVTDHFLKVPCASLRLLRGTSCFLGCILLRRLRRIQRFLDCLLLIRFFCFGFSLSRLLDWVKNPLALEVGRLLVRKLPFRAALKSYIPNGARCWSLLTLWR